MCYPHVWGLFEKFAFFNSPRFLLLCFVRFRRDSLRKIFFNVMELKIYFWNLWGTLFIEFSVENNIFGGIIIKFDGLIEA